ncbi:MAG: rod shape-determining protein MreC [Balneolaceae bacterium]
MRFRLPRITDAKDVILTSIILIFAVNLMISRHDGGLQNIRKASIAVVSYLERPLSTIRIYRQALNTNTYLQRQNVLLQDELSRLRSAEQQNRILRNLLGFRENYTHDLTPVTIVSKELTNLNNTLTISAGEQDSVRVGMPLIDSDGLIGRVILTSDRFAQVMPFTHTLFRVSARIQESRALGIVSWQGQSYQELVMEFVPATIDVEPGQIVETSGFSNQFPDNIPIGEVTRIESGPNIEMNQIFIRPFVTLHTVAEGFVVQFQPDTTIQNLFLEQEGLF